MMIIQEPIKVRGNYLQKFKDLIVYLFSSKHLLQKATISFALENFAYPDAIFLSERLHAEGLNL